MSGELRSIEEAKSGGRSGLKSLGQGAKDIETQRNQPEDQEEHLQQ